MLFVSILNELTERSRRNTSSARRGFAVFDIRKCKDVIGEEAEEVRLSREQAEEMFRWLGERLYGVSIRESITPTPLGGRSER